MGTPHTKPSSSADRADNPGYETEDVKGRGIIISGGVLIIIMVITMLLISSLTGYLEGLAEQGDEPLSPLIESQPTPVGARLQQSPPADMKAFRVEQQEVLQSYQWVDKSNGVVRIPIERAMQLTIERGLPVREGN
jgi:hypothetical protein